MKQKWVIGDDVEVQVKGKVVKAEVWDNATGLVYYQVRGEGGQSVQFLKEEDIVPLPTER